MAENIVVARPLSDAMIDGGDALLRELDRSGMRPSAAFWYLLPETVDWRLFFASAAVQTDGPRSVYGTVAASLQHLGAHANGISLSDIGVLDDDAELVKLFRAAVPTGPGPSRIRFARNVVNGHFIEDALVYRA